MKIEKAIQRNLAKEAGFYDGRFRSKVVPDKKKLQSKISCKTYKYERTF